MAKPLVTDALWERIEPLLPPHKPRRTRFPGRKPLDGPQSSDGHPFRSENRHQLGGPASGDGLRFRHDLWEEAPRLEPGRGLAEAPRDAAGRVAQGGPDRLGAGADRQQLCAGPRRRTDRPQPCRPPKKGEQAPDHHRCGRDSAGGGHDGRPCPRRQSDDRAGGCDPTSARQAGSPTSPAEESVWRPRLRLGPTSPKVAPRGIRPYIARRRTPHGSGLGRYRWYVERTLSWLHNFARLRVRKDKSPEIYQAFLKLGCAMICLRLLCRGSFC